jgi:multidrug efflux pump subunit AcrB
MTVTARLEGSDLGTAITKVQRAVTAMHLPASVRIEYGGTYQEQQQSFHELLRVLLLSLALVFGVLLAEFRNFSAPIAILTSSVLSIAGVVFALLITGASFIGLIMVIGIVAKNGILLLDADERFRDDGETHSHDCVGRNLRYAAARVHPGIRIANAATARHLCHWRTCDLYGSEPDCHARCLLSAHAI